MKRTAIVLAFVLLSACTAPQLGHGSSMTCADRVALAMTSPNATVVGTFACFTANGQNELATRFSPTIKSDHDFQVYAQSAPVLTHFKFSMVAHSSSGQDVRVYRMSDDSGGSECLGVFMAGPKATPNGPDTRQVDYIAFQPTSTGLC